MSLMAGIVKRTTALAHVRAKAYAEANMTARVRVTRPAAPVFDPSNGSLGMAADQVIWEGVGRVASVQGPATYALGDEPQYFSSTFISIPLAAGDPRIDDTVEVLEHLDETLVGRFFRVQDVEAGGQIPVAHRMQVVGVQPSKQWSEG
jgi:hypothetical protein